MSESANTAGGRATETGMAFQAAVATWFAVQMLADVPVGSTFGLPADLKISGLQCETGDAIDDIVVRLDGGGAIYVQCKTRPALTAGSDTLLAKGLAQVVELYARQKRSSSPAGHVRALLAIAEDAPRTLETLNSACRLFDHGGVWDEVNARATAEVRSALRVFEAHVRSAWSTDLNAPLDVGDLVELARLFQIRRFPEDATSEAWRATAHLLGRGLYGSAGAGEGPMATLLGLCRRFIRTGAPVDRAGAMRGLRSAGHVDVSSPGFDKDIEAILTYSHKERERLRKHMSLPIDNGIPVPRDCLTPLRVAAESGSLLVTGEPGAGKTGVLLQLADQMGEAPGPALFLSVERFSGFRKRSDIREELGLDHDPIEVLRAWPGASPGLLIVDALDASRGGPSEAVIASFIEDAVRALGARWSIVASIRSFDLRNGRRFREIMPGETPNPDFAEQDLRGVRHFHVPRLSGGEVAAVAVAAPRLRELVASAPDKFKDLLRNIFNLSLAAELLSAGEDPQSIRAVATQSELIRRYEDIRLPSQRLRLAVKAAVDVMVRRRQLTVRATDIENEAVEEVRQSGVLNPAGDSVAFAHHVLFDHIAARFYLSWDDPDALRVQITQDPTIGLMLGPALRFALEEMWQADQDGRPTTWRFLVDVAGVADPDPVMLSIALRTVAERVDVPSDANALCALIESGNASEAVGRLVGQLARFVGMAAAEGGGLPASAAKAWSHVASIAAATEVERVVDAARVLLLTLAERADLTDPSVLSVFGGAARTLLDTAWSLSPEHQALTTAGIRFVAKSYGTDPDASRTLLSRILDDRFEEHAPQEAPWLAEGVTSIIPHDPIFVARIYTTLFGREVTDDAKTWLGGTPSRILAMTSTRRQDYEHARWRLNKALGSFLEASPIAGTAGVIGAVQGLDTAKRRGRDSPQVVTRLRVGEKDLQVIDDLLSLQDWQEENTHEEEPLSEFVAFLRTCSREAFRDAVTAALALPSNASVWARLLGVAAQRPEVADDMLWPLAADPHFAALQGLSRDAVIFLAAAYPRQPPECRSAFESAALAPDLFPNEQEANWWGSVLNRFLSVIPADLIVTPEMRARRSELEASSKLTGNPPLISMSVEWGSTDDVVDSLLSSQGADLERSPDREIRAASRKLEDRLKPHADAPDIAYLANLWVDIQDLVRLLDEGAQQEPHPRLVHSSWGAISNGVERLAESEAYSPEAKGLPQLDSLLGLIDRLLASPFPERTDTPEDLVSWGNWDVRVYAASSVVALAPRFAESRFDIVDRMASCLRDPTPTVRHQVARALNVLWNVARNHMWTLVSEVADRETHRGVLQFFVGSSLRALSRAEPERCAGILDRVLKRDWDFGNVQNLSRDHASDAFASLAAFLYVACSQNLALRWIERWASDLRHGEAYIAPMLHDLRQVFFFPYLDAPKPEQLEMAARARKLLDLVIGAAVSAIDEARLHLRGSPSQEVIETWRPLYVAGDHVIDQVCNQFYFGSGAFQPPKDPEAEPGLSTSKAKQRFLADHAIILDAIATHAQARTVHSLFELLAYLVDGDPPGVFDRIAKVLLGPAAADGYQFEELGLSSLVAMVRRYLADHRPIFDNATRRRTLVEILELFSSAGWPEALKLLFELPELLR
ncbi:hypothetical protein SAMN05443572_113198 [Myxococcus fulvus]|uniref:Uncharacterized protein n=1 Tax=Myxococcus fulvus TaxID=33 RepID=A0A511TFE7_MYXFU|nr:hypothetical protein [Myxococcus fulvus]GEN11908.1 hypothetical protein MFU01_69450 [Myxococcus fulvus]SEU38793.1 hypothetical protein SAMN05443572_113198 [Myxococcus fulvus]